MSSDYSFGDIQSCVANSIWDSQASCGFLNVLPSFLLASYKPCLAVQVRCMYNWDTLSARAQKLQQFQFSSGLQEQAIGQVVWVDEAGFLSVRQMLESEEKTKAYYQAPNVSSAD